jgi:predicted DNA-binding transcriptional regulator YafY
MIALKSTGKPSECANKIGISERSLYDYLRILKEMGAPIVFSRNRGTYLYKEQGRFRISFIARYKEEFPEEMLA